MRITRIDDYQSWLFEEEGTSLLLDPWLEQRFALPPGGWFLARRRHEGPPVDANRLPDPDAILLSAHFADHLHEDTLERFARHTPVHTTSLAARQLRKLGFTHVRAHRSGQRFEVAPGFVVETIRPAFPYAQSALGFLLEGTTSGHRVYVEGHVTDERQLASLGRVDALITTCESVHVGPVQLAMDAARAERSARALSPRYFLPTGVGPGLSTGVFARYVTRCSGTIDDLGRALAEQRSATEVARLGIGESIELASGARSARFAA